MTTKLLVAIDFSEAADEALRQAHERARDSGSTLTVLHVIPNLAHSTPLFPEISQDEVRESPALGQTALAEVSRRVQAVTGRNPEEFEPVIADGSPAAVIVREAERRNIDLLLVGSHGKSGVVRLFLGNVAEKVVRHAHCPVLVVRPRSGTGDVLVATDFSDAALPAVAAAVREARLRGGRLTIIHSIDLSPGLTEGVSSAAGVVPYVAPPEISSDLRQTVDGMLANALQRFEGEGERIVAEGPPAAAIVRTAKRLGTDLVVVGTVGRTGLPRLLLGSVAEVVVRSAPCSVLVVRLGPGEDLPGAGAE